VIIRALKRRAALGARSHEPFRFEENQMLRISCLAFIAFGLQACSSSETFGVQRPTLVSAAAAQDLQYPFGHARRASSREFR
jgi:hypothetical protein